MMPNIFGNDYQRLVEMERDGIRLSQKYRWDIDDIVNVFAAALEDANAHTLRSKIVDIYKAECLAEDNLPNPFGEEATQ
jgi:hypothetical protein